MQKENPSLTEILKILADVYENKLPFNKVLGLRIDRLEPGNVRVVFDMKPELVGNYVHGVLHGGVVSSVLDATGGIVASIGVANSWIGKDWLIFIAISLSITFVLAAPVIDKLDLVHRIVTGARAGAPGVP